ncbi:hypothetical protein [Pseudonocardia aurantiaca]|uniref:Uncharacterized protein n=1 Tax=Pseudonocardia aurantiaca TaxID=75290 RepID=A0ABW4FI02_9PSEU
MCPEPGGVPAAPALAGVGWALVGRLPGIALRVLAVALLPARWFAAAVAVTVLVCAGLSVLRWRPRPSPPALVVAGVVSGAGGTASAIGGPPVALLLLPFMVAGYAVSTPARRLLDRGWTRPAVLAVAVGGALALLATAVVG